MLLPSSPPSTHTHAPPSPSIPPSLLFSPFSSPPSLSPIPSFKSLYLLHSLPSLSTLLNFPSLTPSLLPPPYIYLPPPYLPPSPYRSLTASLPPSLPPYLPLHPPFTPSIILAHLPSLPPSLPHLHPAGPSDWHQYKRPDHCLLSPTPPLGPLQTVSL